MIKRFLTCLLCLSLSGCASWGAYISESARESAEFTLCRGMSVGTWVRAYASDANKAHAWRTLCTPYIVNVPVDAAVK